MTNEVVKLPTEVEQIARNVSPEKRNEVQSTLNHVFNGVSKMREQLDNVQVADETDKVSMSVARQIRLGVRNERLTAEKTFDAKRAEVQQAMLSFKTEDSLWLKAKQTMQILTKEIEAQAKWKETTAERAEAERRELKIQQRVIAVQKFDPEIERSEVEHMSDAVFETFLAGIEKAYNERIEAEKAAEKARIEAEQKAKKHAEREAKARYLGSFFDWEKSNVDVTDADWAKLVNEAESKKAAYDKKQAEIKAENERLQKEAEAERKKAAKIKAELKAQAEAKAKAEKEAAEKAKSAAAAPDREKIIAAVNGIEFNLPECKSQEMQQVANDINAKFEGFKKWAISQTEKL